MNYEGFCVRLDARDGYKELLSQFASAMDYKGFVAVEHKGTSGENPHYHFVVRTEVKDDAFRKRMKKVFTKGKGNGHMSIKPWDGSIDAIAYLFHEDPEASLLVKVNVSDETITKARARNNSVQQQVKTAKEKASWKLEDELYEKLKGLRPGQVPEEPDLAYMLVMKSLRSGKYVPNDWLLKSMATKLRFRLMEGDVRAEEALCNQIISKVYRTETPYHFEFNRYGNADALKGWG